MPAAFKWSIYGLTVLAVFLVYQNYSPYDFEYYPKCPLKWTTGYDCAGCGSQRAIHYLLNLQFISAFKENALLVVSIPYIVVELILDRLPNSRNAGIISRKLYGGRAILIWFVVVLLWWFLRNIFNV